MADQTSNLYLNGCNFYTTVTGCRFTKGSVFFDNKVLAISNAAKGITASTPLTQAASTATLLNNISAVAWSPDGRYIATAGAVASSGQLQILYFNGSNSLTSYATDGTPASETSSAAWSPDGKYIALVCYAVNKLFFILY